MGRLRASLAATSPVILAFTLTRCLGAEPTLVDGGNEPRGETSTHLHPDASEGGSARDAGSDVTHVADAVADTTMHDAIVPDAGHDATMMTTPDATPDVTTPPIDAGHEATMDAAHEAMTTPVDATHDAEEDVAHDAGHDVAVDSYVCYATVDAGGPPGSVDQNFENGDKDNGSPPSPAKAIIDATGRIYIIGARTNCVNATSQGDFAITRFTAAGGLDTTFGSAGTFCIDFSGGSDGASSGAFDGAGNIVLVGSATGAAPTKGDATAGAIYAQTSVAMARVTSAGTLDTSFGNGGTLRPVLLSDTGVCPNGGSNCAPPEAQVATSIAFDSSHKHFYVVGTSVDFPAVGGTAFTSGFVGAFNSDGTINGNFNSSGGATTSKYGGVGFVADDSITEFDDVAVDGAGNIVVVGEDRGAATTTDSGYNNQNRSFLTRRYLSTGVFDTSFNPSGPTPGQVKTALGTEDYAMAVHLNPVTGAITVAGATSVGGPTHQNSGVYAAGAAGVARYTSTGSLDTTFNTTGTFVSTQLQIFPGYEHFILDVQCDGRVLVGGFVGTQTGCAQGVQDCQTIAVLRLTGMGAIDTAYSTRNDAGPGIASFPITNANALTSQVTLDENEDGLVLAGDHLGNPLLEHVFH